MCIRDRALLDFIRFKSGDYCENMLGILLDDSKDRELRFSAIRYFGRYPYPPVRQPLLAAVTDLNPLNWEFAAISAASLARYSGDDVVEALSQAMHSGNWYVRYNAAASLAAHGLSYEKDVYKRQGLLTVRGAVWAPFVFGLKIYGEGISGEWNKSGEELT